MTAVPSCALVPAIDLLLLNEREHESLGTVDGPLVVVKHGAGGAAAHTACGVVRAAGHPVEVVDTTGAGDSFDAGFLAAWLAAEPPERRWRWAMPAERSRRGRWRHHRAGDDGRGEGGGGMIVPGGEPVGRPAVRGRPADAGGIHRPTEFAQVAEARALNVARAASRWAPSAGGGAAGRARGALDRRAVRTRGRRAGGGPGRRRRRARRCRWPGPTRG